MNNTEDLINKYFEGSLTKSEQQTFDQLLTNDAEFKESFEFESDVRTAFVSEKKDSLRRIFKDVENSKPTSNTKNSSIVKYLVAASVAILIGVLGFNTFFKNSVSHEQLFAQNFEPYRNIIAPITRGEEQNSPKELAFAAYEKQNYKESIPDFKNLYEESKEPYYLFYIANAQLATDDTAAAIVTFKKHLEFNDDFFEKSKWYLALAYLKDNETQKAKTLLKSISEKKLFNYKKAAEILDEL